METRLLTWFAAELDPADGAQQSYAEDLPPDSGFQKEFLQYATGGGGCYQFVRDTLGRKLRPGEAGYVAAHTHAKRESFID